MRQKTKTLNPMIPIQNAQLLAIEGILENSLDAFERKVRRWFSKEHSTPYVETFKIPWDELLLHYYESSLASKSYNEVYDLAMEEFLPEFIEKAEKDDQAFADSLLKEQEATLKDKKLKVKQGDGLKEKMQQEASGELKSDIKEQSINDTLDKKDNKPVPKTMSLKFDDSEEL